MQTRINKTQPNIIQKRARIKTVQFCKENMLIRSMVFCKRKSNRRKQDSYPDVTQIVSALTCRDRVFREKIRADTTDTLQSSLLISSVLQICPTTTFETYVGYVKKQTFFREKSEKKSLICINAVKNRRVSKDASERQSITKRTIKIAKQNAIRRRTEKLFFKKINHRLRGVLRPIVCASINVVCSAAFDVER
jgi:hypothetical protein